MKNMHYNIIAITNFITECFFLLLCLKETSSEHHWGPDNVLLLNDTTTCEEFGQFARFNPNSVLNDEWFLFYYWAPVQGPTFVTFLMPTTRQLQYIKHILDNHVIEPVNWTARHILMRDRSNKTVLMVEQGERGQYLFYDLYRGLKKTDIITPREVRIKQTGDNKIFGIMHCETQMMFVFSKLKEVPKKAEVQDAAARIGFRGRGGKSYLYQGHQWMPIGELDDWEFEEAMNIKEKRTSNVR